MGRSHSIRILLLMTAFVAGAGCGDDVSTTTDGGVVGDPPQDASTRDASTQDDAGLHDTGGAAPSNVEGKVVHTLSVGGLDREMIVYVPAGAVGTDPVPVVFMLHGTSGDGERFYNISQWKEKADEEGFIAVFPSALTHCFFEDENGDGDFSDPGERKVTTKWAASKLGDPTVMPLCTAQDIASLIPANRALTDHPLADDLAFFDAMLDFLAENYAVDQKRIYASGFSNGGGMTSHLARERNDRFAALSASAGFLWGEGRPASWPISFVATLGSNDDRFTGALMLTSIPVSSTLLMDVPFLQGALMDYRTICQLSEDYTYTERMVGQNKVGDFAFQTSASGAGNELHFIIIEGLGHQYPNGTNHPVRLANFLWTFFSTKSLP